MKKTALKRKSSRSLPRLHAKAWTLMSEYIRRRDEKNGCISCGKMIPWKDAHCGHYVHRASMDYNLKNLNLQCCACNTYLHGNLAEYTFAINKKWGSGTAEELLAQKHIIKKFTREEIENIIIATKELLKGLTI